MKRNIPRNILLAEDNDDDAFLTQRALEAGGISEPIHRCRDGQDVIEYLDRFCSGKGTSANALPPDLVLLDLKMPRLDGMETLKWIRRHEIFHSMIVLALTSSNEKRDVETAYRLHINAYLVKPSSLSEMVGIARTLREFWMDQKHLLMPQFDFPFGRDVARS
ncbi:MAG: response regulator [Methylacidiphilales bacterium]|nr:response regulator [Candidatus Methylacidiphilales bacterium]